MVSTEILEMWRNRLDSFANSRLSPREWCELNDVVLHQFYYWRKRLTKLAHAEDLEHQWLTVDLRDTPSADSHPVIYPDTISHITISAPAGLNIRIADAVIELQHGFDPALLRSAVQALRSLPC